MKLIWISLVDRDRNSPDQYTPWPRGINPTAPYAVHRHRPPPGSMMFLQPLLETPSNQFAASLISGESRTNGILDITAGIEQMGVAL